MADKGTWKLTIGTTLVSDYTDTLAAAPVNGGPVIQEEPTINGITPTFFQRGNQKFIRQFTHTKQWDTNALSAAWYMTDGPVLAGVADVYLSHKDYSGTEATWKISGAKVEINIEEPIGVTTISKITVTGGLPILQA